MTNYEIMSDIIYNKDCPEYAGYGNYTIDGIEYFTIDSYKQNILYVDSNKNENSDDSIELGKYVHCDCIKVKPEVGSTPFVMAYSRERLEEYFSLK